MKSQSNLRNRLGLGFARQISRLPKPVQMLIAVTFTFGAWLVLLPLVITSIRQQYTYGRLPSQGIVTTGVVINGPSAKNYPVHYDFQVKHPDGTLTTIHATELTGENLPWPKPGDVVYLRYDPADPSISRLDGNTVIPNDFLFLTPLFIILTIVNLMLLWFGLMRLVRLIRARRPTST